MSRHPVHEVTPAGQPVVTSGGKAIASFIEFSKAVKEDAKTEDANPLGATASARASLKPGTGTPCDRTAGTDILTLMVSGI